jgi:chromosome partitioning protein
LKVAGFLPTMFDGRSRHALEVMEHIASQAHLWGVRAFKPIPKSVRFAEASSAGLPISRYAPESLAARAYESLAEEIDRSFVSQAALSALSLRHRAPASPSPIEAA